LPSFTDPIDEPASVVGGLVLDSNRFQGTSKAQSIRDNRLLVINAATVAGALSSAQQITMSKSLGMPAEDL